jgi:hypothetical protein
MSALHVHPLTADRWAGFVEMFRAAGFEEVERRSPTRPIMRYAIEAAPPVGNAASE